MTVVLRITETTQYPCGARQVAKGWVLAWLGIGYTRQLGRRTKPGCPVHGWRCSPTACRHIAASVRMNGTIVECPSCDIYQEPGDVPA